MGAAALLAMARAGLCPFERMVATAPMIDIAKIKRKTGARLLAACLDIIGLGAHFIPGGGETSSMTRPFDVNDLTSDPQRYARNARILAAYPFLGIGDPTIGWLNAALRLTSQFAAPDFPRRIETPVLAFLGDDDSVTSTRQAARFFARMKAGRAILLPGARHEILQERDAIRDLFWAAFDAFLPGAPAPAPAHHPAPTRAKAWWRGGWFHRKPAALTDPASQSPA
jgi:lysophospholipase